MKKGFTLLELLVALGIFATTAVLVVGSFLTLSASQKTIREKQDALNELRFALDLIGQEVTSGSAFPDGCENGCQSIVFVTKIRPDVPLRRVEYGLDPVKNVLVRGEQRVFGLCATIPLAADCYQPLTSEDLSIARLTFFVDHKGENIQPIVTIEIQGTAQPGTPQAETVNVSTTFSPRLLQDPNVLPPAEKVLPTIQITSPTPADTYTTSNPSLILQGVASDNVGVTEVRWRNEAAGTSGFATADSPGFAFWSTPSIALVPSATNVLVVEARDAAGNIGADTLTVESTTPPPPPGTPTLSAWPSCSSSGKPRAHLTWSSEEGADDYHIYRCIGSSCTPTSQVKTITATSWNDYDVIVGTTYRYRVRAHNHTTSLFSDYSETRSVTIATCTAKGSSGGSDGGKNGKGSGGGKSFSLSADSLIRAGVTGNTTTKAKSTKTKIRVNPSGGFDNDISLSASGGPSGISYSFQPSELEEDEYNKGSQFSVTIPDSTSVGIYTITVTGSGGGKSASVGVTLDVFAKGGGQL